MKTLSKASCRAILEAGRWGLRVVQSDHGILAAKLNTVSLAPQHLMALDFAEGVLAVDVSEFDSDTLAPAIVHEICHWAVGGNPERHNELAALLWLEYEADRRLKIARTEWMYDFSIASSGVTWGEIDAVHRGRLLRDAKEIAVQAGLSNTDGTPTYRIGK